MGWIPIDVEMEMLHQIPKPYVEVERFPVINELQCGSGCMCFDE